MVMMPRESQEDKPYLGNSFQISHAALDAAIYLDNKILGKKPKRDYSKFTKEMKTGVKLLKEIYKPFSMKNFMFSDVKQFWLNIVKEEYNIDINKDENIKQAATGLELIVDEFKKINKLKKEELEYLRDFCLSVSRETMNYTPIEKKQYVS
jgi:hypothetical protein